MVVGGEESERKGHKRGGESGEGRITHDREVRRRLAEKEARRLEVSVWEPQVESNMDEEIGECDVEIDNVAFHITACGLGPWLRGEHQSKTHLESGVEHTQQVFDKYGSTVREHVLEMYSAGRANRMAERMGLVA